MREILFRGKRRDNGQWVEGAFCPKNTDGPFGPMKDDPSIIKLDKPYDGFWFAVDGDTVGQHIGLKDKNGKPIFEGDLCLCDRHINDSFDKTVFEIMFDPLRGYYGESSWGSEFDGTSFELCEVIGNIHDNPELLKEDPDE